MNKLARPQSIKDNAINLEAKFWITFLSLALCQSKAVVDHSLLIGTISNQDVKHIHAFQMNGSNINYCPGKHDTIIALTKAQKVDIPQNGPTFAQQRKMRETTFTDLYHHKISELEIGYICVYRVLQFERNIFNNL